MVIFRIFRGMLRAILVIFPVIIPWEIGILMVAFYLVLIIVGLLIVSAITITALQFEIVGFIRSVGAIFPSNLRLSSCAGEIPMVHRIGGVSCIEPWASERVLGKVVLPVRRIGSVCL